MRSSPDRRDTVSELHSGDDYIGVMILMGAMLSARRLHQEHQLVIVAVAWSSISVQPRERGRVQRHDGEYGRRIAASSICWWTIVDETKAGWGCCALFGGGG
jgi:hypothetical protein